MKSLIGFLYRKKMQMLPGIEMGKFPPIRWVRDSWRRKARKDVVEIDGHIIRVDPLDSLDLSVFGAYEPEVLRLFAEILHPGDVAVDVGANIGHHTLFMARAVGPTGKVYAFEPAPQNFDLLCLNVKANNYSNVILNQKAVLDQPRQVNLFLSGENLADHRVYDAAHDRAAVSVEGVCLDEELAGESGKVTLVKMDVQGAEMAVLKGMEQVMKSNPHMTLLMEFWPHGLSMAGTDPLEVLDHLTRHGFSFFDVKNPQRSFEWDTLKAYARTEKRQDSARHMDLLCRRR
jgi:FkbM family methyltransferase